jgi:hypothetical protein
MLRTSCSHPDSEFCSACTPICAACLQSHPALHPIPVRLNGGDEVVRVCGDCFPSHQAVDPQDF